MTPGANERILLVGLTKAELDAVIIQLRQSVPEPNRQPYVLSAIGKMLRAAEMKPSGGAETKLG